MKRFLISFIIISCFVTSLLGQQKYTHKTHTKYKNTGYYNLVGVSAFPKHVTFDFLLIRYKFLNFGVLSYGMPWDDEENEGLWFYQWGPLGISLPIYTGKKFDLRSNANVYYLVQDPILGNSSNLNNKSFGYEFSLKLDLPFLNFTGGYRIGNTMSYMSTSYLSMSSGDLLTADPFDGFYISASLCLGTFFQGRSNSTITSQKRSKAPNPRLVLSSNVNEINELDAGEKSDIEIRIENKGKGFAEKVKLDIKQDNNLLSLNNAPNDLYLHVGDIKPGGVYKTSISLQPKSHLINSHSYTKLSVTAKEIDGFSSFCDIPLSILPQKEIEKFPPILDVDVSYIDSNENNLLDALEKSTIQLKITNNGRGNAWNVKGEIKLNNIIEGIEYDKIQSIRKIEPGGIAIFEFPINANMDIQTEYLNFGILVTEANGYDANAISFTLGTQIFFPPELKITNVGINDKNSENSFGNANSIIENLETIEVTVILQNVGQGTANNVSAMVLSDDQNIMILSEFDKFQIGELAAGEYSVLKFSFNVNNRYKGDARLPINLNVIESYNKFGLSKNLGLNINKKTLASEDINVIGKYYTTKKIESIQSTLSDVDKDIPFSKISKNESYALIIGNEDYKSRQVNLKTEQNVKFAENDAIIFASYCEKTLGIPKKQIKLLINATAAEIQRGLAWINNLAKVENGKAEIIFYYSGHGLPDEQTREAYLIPVDVSGNQLKYAMKLADIYSDLSEHPALKITVFIDACFSGGARNESLLARKGMRVKPKEEYIKNNMFVFSSSTGDESSGIFQEKQHGFFTYFLLKKLKETYGNINYKELSDYVIRNVRKETAILGKIQTPVVQVNSTIIDDWENWKFK